MPQRVPDNLDFLNKIVLIILIGPCMEEALLIKFEILAVKYVYFNNLSPILHIS